MLVLSALLPHFSILKNRLHVVKFKHLDANDGSHFLKVQAAREAWKADAP